MTIVVGGSSAAQSDLEIAKQRQARFLQTFPWAAWAGRPQALLSSSVMHANTTQSARHTSCCLINFPVLSLSSLDIASVSPPCYLPFRCAAAAAFSH